MLSIITPVLNGEYFINNNILAIQKLNIPFEHILVDGGSTDNFIYKTQALAGNATFEHTTRIVLEGTDELGFITGGSANVDVTVSYLDQTL